MADDIAHITNANNSWVFWRNAAIGKPDQWLRTTDGKWAPMSIRSDCLHSLEVFDAANPVGSPDDSPGTDRLAAEYVLGRLWEGAPVVATPTVYWHGDKDPIGDMVYLGIDAGDEIFYSLKRGRRTNWADSKHGWSLSLRLPGPLGCGAHGLERRIQGHLAGVEVVPGWCRTLPAAEVSKRLVMLDGLAALRGWPTGPGATVYGWEQQTRSTWLLTCETGPDTRKCGRYACELTDPMEALEAAYRATR